MQSPRDFSMYGAVDLGARQAAAQRRQQAARAAEAAGAGDGAPAAVLANPKVREIYLGSDINTSAVEAVLEQEDAKNE